MMYEHLDAIPALVEQKLVNRRVHPTLPLWIHNYSAGAQYMPVAEWPPAMCDCRGLEVTAPAAKPLEIGDRVYLTGDHPHAAESGTVESVERTLAGLGLKIRLENCPHGTDACFVFKPEHLRRERRLP